MTSIPSCKSYIALWLLTWQALGLFERPEIRRAIYVAMADRVKLSSALHGGLRQNLIV